MALSLQDILSAPDDADALHRHLQGLGLIAPPPAAVPIVPSATVGPLSPVTPHSDVAPMTPPVVSERGAMTPLLGRSKEIALGATAQPVKPMAKPENTGATPDIGATAFNPLPPSSGIASAISSPRAVTPKESIAAGMEQHGTTPKEEGRRQFEELRPQITASPGSSDFYRQQIAQAEFDKTHPWGGDISAHPGLLGKIGHVAGEIGQVAGGILNPNIVAEIPGTRLNRAVKEAGATEELGKAETQERAAKTAESEEALRAKQVENLQSEIEQREQEKPEHKDIVKEFSDALASGDQTRIDALAPRVQQYLEATQKPGAEKNTKEQIQAQINAELAKPAPDQKVVKGLQARLKAIDPLGAERLNVTIGQKGEEEKAIDIAAQALANGDLTRLKDIASMRGDQRLRIFARVKELNPNFTTAKIDRQIRMFEQYTTGKQGDQLQSFGTFLEHAGALKDTMDSLAAEGLTSSKLLNHSVNWLRKNVSDDPAYPRVLAALDPVQKEFETYLLNNRALYTEDRATVDQIINGDLPLKQMEGSLQQMGHTVQARFTEADKRFRNTMDGKSIEELVGPLSDEAQEGARKIGVKIGSAPEKEEAKPPRPPAAGMEWRRNKKTGEFREFPVTNAKPTA